MKILSVFSTFPPYVYGGGEDSALNLTKWLASQGHRMGVLTAAEEGQQELYGETIDGLEVWRLRYRRQYTYSTHMKASKWQKPLWYLQDHLDPDNRRKMAAVLDEFQPDCTTVHVIAGLGYNSLYEIGRRNIPTVYFMHDLNLVCFKGGMFSNGKECVRRCATCVAIGRLRFAAVSSIARLAFCSPSRANLEAAAEFIPVKKYLNTVLLNANKYPEPTAIRASSTKVRFLYVGRLHAAKGVNVLLNALDELAKSFEFELNIVGSGQEEILLRERFGDREWCRFHGHVTQQQVSNFMQGSDALCVPSIWRENSPGVVIHALSQGLPVIGSDKGGIPELVKHDRNGLLVRAGDTDAWRMALQGILMEPKILEAWRTNLAKEANLFDQVQLGHKLLQLIVDTTKISAAT